MGTEKLIELAFTAVLFILLVATASLRIRYLKRELAKLDDLCDRLHERLSERNEENFRLQAALGMQKKDSKDAAGDQ